MIETPINPCNPSPCGNNAICNKHPNSEHVATCVCPKGYVGDPFLLCRKECVCGQGKRGQDPESFVDKKVDRFKRSGIMNFVGQGRGRFIKRFDSIKKKANLTAEVKQNDMSNRTRIKNEPWNPPWITVIHIKIGRKKFMCGGGSIINNYWILSSGHCFCAHLKCKPSEGGHLKIAFKPQDHIRIVTGVKDIDQIYSKKHQVFIPEEIFIHPM